MGRNGTIYDKNKLLLSPNSLAEGKNLLSVPLIFKEDDLVEVSGTTIVDKGFHGSLFLCKIKDTGGRRWTKDNAYSLNMWIRWQVKCIKRSGDVLFHAMWHTKGLFGRSKKVKGKIVRGKIVEGMKESRK
ncbi:hypothetical protein MTR_1g085930 [Medicago truncatula]|uniref:Uncharacterized protein n=1 Tax=Medicago truncatula TaxID=3880 RepID=G7IBP7_MEDTR|nr:hypothetical protein MTR_1g085930 [Medicago truncatula]